MNALACICAASVTEKKSFIVLAPSLIFVPMAKDRGTGHRFVILHCKTIYSHKKLKITAIQTNKNALSLMRETINVA